MSPPAIEPLPPETAAKLAEFARACKAATRIVSMYPATHPAIQSALGRITEAGKQAVSYGPFPITVLPDGLLVGGRGLAKPEPSVGELAALLHQALIGEMTLMSELDNTQWHGFLTLLAKPPEEAWAMGGVAKAWKETGSKAIALKEIDYAEVLRERAGTGESASWDRILAALNDEKKEDGLEQGAMDSMLEMVSEPSRLVNFAEKLQAQGKAAGDDSIQQRKSLHELMHSLANYAAEKQPEELDSVLNNMAGAAAQLPPEMLLTLITDPPPAPTGQPGAPRLDLASELQARLTDEMLTKFLVDNVVKDRGASSRLAAAFQTLVPDPDRQQNILAAATEQAMKMFENDPEFEKVWSSSSQMLTSYSDSQFVSDDYARELTMARSQAVSIDKIGDDPPNRVRAWLSTMADEEVRALDQHLLLDLLNIEAREDAWASVLDTAVANIEQLALVGDMPLAAQLVERIVAVSRDEASPFASFATLGVKKIVDGPLVKHMTMFLRQATDAEVPVANKICATIGPDLVGPLADALAAEENPRTVMRLRDILIKYGAAARRHADELRRSTNPAVRRAAVELLRALGGEAALPDLRNMLDDKDPQVQRGAMRGIVQIGSPQAFAELERALESGKSHTKEFILQALSGLRDERAAPMFVYILTHTGYNGPLEGAYVSWIESLGRIANDERSVDALKEILYRGEWYAPGRTARIRAAAARALRAIAHPSADTALNDAAANGPGGVRRAAKAALADPAPTRSARRQQA